MCVYVSDHSETYGIEDWEGNKQKNQLLNPVLLVDNGLHVWYDVPSFFWHFMCRIPGSLYERSVNVM